MTFSFNQINTIQQKNVQCRSLRSLEGKLLDFKHEGGQCIKHAIGWEGKMY